MNYLNSTIKAIDEDLPFTQEELSLLESSTGLKYLIQQGKPNFRAVLDIMKKEQEIRRLQAEMIQLQSWVVKNNARVLILIEGREFAGKGGAIRSFTEHLNPRSMRIVALPKPSLKEAGQWYFQRYMNQLPDPGEIVFFDRSWYNRAIVEPVNGFCTKSEYRKFMKEVNHFERMMVEDGIRMIKFYLSISKEEQINRIEEVRTNPLRRWELTPVDEKAVSLWDQYTKYKDAMFDQTDSTIAPWVIIKADDKLETLIVAMKYILSSIPYRKKK